LPTGLPKHPALADLVEPRVLEVDKVDETDLEGAVVMHPAQVEMHPEGATA